MLTQNLSAFKKSIAVPHCNEKNLASNYTLRQAQCDGTYYLLKDLLLITYHLLLTTYD